ncbi:MAG TPA: leucyl aminopeptidase [Chloroflexi bacterium]|jgi:leucyl aminopeptidase|nr:leucyl aminopeptidase [Chloroflexota bacterium]HAL25530.1 leucyl aminopeptidase [Chloroflexota bacterium]
MKFRAVRPADAAQADVTIVPLFDDRQAPKSLARGKRAIVERLAGERGAASLYNVFTHVGGDKEGRVVVVGAGKRAEYDAERARNIASAGIKSLWKTDAKTAAIYVDGTIGEARAVQAAVEGAHFAMWRPEAHRSKPEERRLPPLSTVSIVAEGNVRDAIRRGDAVGQAVNLARRMANEPANKMTPTIVAQEARALAKEAGLDIEVLDRKKCESLGMFSYLSVAQGSHEPPQCIVLRYRGRGGKGFDLGMVGKGITFDSGGISIKPAEGMHHMKADMTGAASVIAAMTAIAALKPKVNVIAVAPCTENLPGGGATKPGDVFTSMSGKTVEVINTDAEGRLVLVDGITYAQREGATRVVDVATLTGAIAVALGNHFSGLFGKPDSFVDEVRRVGVEAGDRLWPMPLTDEYRDEIKSDIADLTNSAGREGGAIKAAAFLDAAVEDGTEWAHLDIAGTFWSDRDRSHSPKGPQGPSVRTLVALAERYART